MNFNKHSEFLGMHAFLGASKYHWLNYDTEKLATTWHNQNAAAHGTRLHALASELITLGVKLPRNDKTLNRYVNDAIGYKMTPEVPLVYSINAFGTADAIGFKNGRLRIHDLKTGVTRANVLQLYIYAAFFCLEYRLKPGEIDFELRIYQNDEVFVDTPEADDILPVIDKIITFDKFIEKMKAEAL